MRLYNIAPIKSDKPDTASNRLQPAKSGDHLGDKNENLYKESEMIGGISVLWLLTYCSMHGTRLRPEKSVEFCCSQYF